MAILHSAFVTAIAWTAVTSPPRIRETTAPPLDGATPPRAAPQATPQAASPWPPSEGWKGPSFAVYTACSAPPHAPRPWGAATGDAADLSLGGMAGVVAPARGHMPNRSSSPKVRKLLVGRAHHRMSHRTHGAGASDDELSNPDTDTAGATTAVASTPPTPCASSSQYPSSSLLPPPSLCAPSPTVPTVFYE